MKSSFRLHVVCVTLGLACIAFACARLSKEPEKASPASPPAVHELSTQRQTPSPPASAQEEAVEAHPSSAAIGEPEESATTQAKKRSSGGVSPSPSPPRLAGGASRAETAAAPKAASPAYAPADDATPTMVEPPELQAAIAEFDSHWQKLSTTRVCDDACRALESMRRSAQRICDLVVASDPNQRCRTAQVRLDRATRDLAARCSTCR